MAIRFGNVESMFGGVVGVQVDWAWFKRKGVGTGDSKHRQLHEWLRCTGEKRNAVVASTVNGVKTPF